MQEVNKHIYQKQDDKKNVSTLSFRDSIATIDKEGRRKFIYPKKPKGKYYRLRTITSLIFLTVFVVVPFIKIDGEPMMLFDVIGRKFILFGQIFWPQDFFIFAVGFITFIVFIIVFTVAFGRLFCGWVCPQTNFMEMIFRKVEYLIDGDAHHQMQLANMPWNTEKILKRSTKIIAFYGISLFIAHFFLAYLIGVDHLKLLILEGIGKHSGTFFSLIGFTTVFFFVYYWFREQACIVVCPYGRLQGVLLDKNSMVVAYDYKRGEPRGKLKHDEKTSSQGDCIDCYACVRVCPTGIDIRNGTQLECINCTACIDACDAIMDHVHKPKGLIRYASEHDIKSDIPTRFTKRMALYSTLLLLLVGVLATLLITRDDVDVRILRAQGQTYHVLPDGRVGNLYNIKLTNKTRKEVPLQLKLENVKGEIQMIQSIIVEKESYFQTSFFVKLDRKEIHQRKQPIIIGIYKNAKCIQKRNTTFLSPSIL
jgi:cytochrome c oxidase accessory protein FixG